MFDSFLKSRLYSKYVFYGRILVLSSFNCWTRIQLYSAIFSVDPSNPVIFPFRRNAKFDFVDILYLLCISDFYEIVLAQFLINSAPELNENV